MARRSTWVEPQGTQMMMRGDGGTLGVVHHLDELLEHLLGDGEVGDHAVLHRADGLDVAGHLAQHGLGFVADGLDGLLAVGAAFMADGDDRGLVQDDALAAHVNQGVGGAKVDGEVGGEVPTEGGEHGVGLAAGAVRPKFGLEPVRGTWPGVTSISARPPNRGSRALVTAALQGLGSGSLEGMQDGRR
jgi:hypothetical protein